MPNLILNPVANLKNGVIMVVTEWKSFSKVDPKRDYLAFALAGHRKSAWSFFSWGLPAGKVMKQLETTNGLVGYTSRMDFLSKKSEMVAVFEDEKTLMEFAHAGQHGQCAEKSKSGVKQMTSATWIISGSDIPLKLDDAVKRLQSQKDINLINH
jgi:hypothetical protein